MTVILETKGIKKYFPVTKGLIFSKTSGLIKAVDGVDLYIDTGETLGLVGESGCGKTTVAKLILLLDKLTEGSILFQGKDLSQFTVSGLRQYRKSVQAVFQNPFSSLDPRMHVSSIISEPLKVNENLTKKQLENRIGKALEEIGLSASDAQKYPHQFSGGQKQRIAIARALASNPSLIILDEPVSSQDVSIRAQLLNLLKDLQERLEISFLFIAHDLATVRYMCNRINVMYLGQIVETAESDSLFDKPLHPYTKALLLASLPDKPDSRRTGSVISGEVPSPLNPSEGCRFYKRCSQAQPDCAEHNPSLKEMGPGHSVACLLYK